MAKNKKASFMVNVLTIIFSQVLVKLLGFAYRMVITNIDGFGDLGNGYYNFGFQIYTLLLSISSVGIPNAISKLVSERCALNDFKGATRIFKISLGLFSVIGGFFSCLLYFGAEPFSVYVLSAPGAVYTMKVLAPSILFVSVSSVIRGFFMGQQNANATSTSQVLEQFLKSTLTIVIVMLMTGQSAEYMAAGATLATTVSTALSLVYLFGFYRAHKKELKEKYDAAPDIKEAAGVFATAKTVLWVSVPISLGSVVTSLNRVLDTITVNRGLKTAFFNLISDPVLLDENAVVLSGVLSKTDVLINLPLAINIAFATVLVPTIAGALATKDYETASKRVAFSMLTSIVIALPCTAGYMVLSDEIMSMIYFNASSGGILLAMMAPSVFFSAMNQTIYGSLQGMGKIFVPAVSVLCGGVVKLIINLTLIPIESINIYGAPIGSVLCQAIAFCVSFGVLRKNLPVKMNFGRYFLRPFGATLGMSAAVWCIYRVSHAFLGNTVATLLSIVMGAIVYFALIFLLKVFTKEELLMLPFGKKIARLFKA